MAEQLKPPLPPSHASTLREDSVRRLSRSPHPYHRQKSELANASERFSAIPPPNRPFRSAASTDHEAPDSQAMVSEGGRESTNSDSGSEADDEHFLKGLPAPRLRPPKGLRGADGSLSNTPSPLLSPAILDEAIQEGFGSSTRTSTSPEALNEKELQKAVEMLRQKRKVEIVRRVTESGILGFVAVILCLNPEVRELVSLWRKGKAQATSIAGQANYSRTVLPSSYHCFPRGCIPLPLTTPHKSPTAMESTTSSGNSDKFRPCPSALPANNHYTRFDAALPEKSHRVSARHNPVHIITSQGPDTISWGT
jgi:hypothetical protein